MKIRILLYPALLLLTHAATAQPNAERDAARARVSDAVQRKDFSAAIAAETV